MEIQNTLQKAIGCFQQGLHKQSLEIISQLLEFHPHSGTAWELKGLVEDSLSWLNKSICSLETATTFAPISASGQYVLAKNYLQIGKHALAKSVFSILLQRNDIPEKLLPAVAALLGQHPDLTHLALEACRKSVQLNPEIGNSWLAMACFMGKLGYPPQHRANVLRKAVSIDPENRHCRMALSHLLLQSGQIDDAYLVVKEIDTAELSKIQCPECLQKLITIFSQAQDDARYEICRKLLKRLQPSEIRNHSNRFSVRFTDSLNN
tara:strand:+ start:482 stop:1273 length:792 start_codon:yes stop_codon:yes gene_type:complete